MGVSVVDSPERGVVLGHWGLLSSKDVIALSILNWPCCITTHACGIVPILANISSTYTCELVGETWILPHNIEMLMHTIYAAIMFHISLCSSVFSINSIKPHLLERMLQTWYYTDSPTAQNAFQPIPDLIMDEMGTAISCKKVAGLVHGHILNWGMVSLLYDTLL